MTDLVSWHEVKTGIFHENVSEALQAEVNKLRQYKTFESTLQITFRKALTDVLEDSVEL